MLALYVSAAIAFALVATRMGAFVAVSPFPGAAVPAYVKVGLVLLLALAAAPAVMPPKHATFGLWLVSASLGEMATGVAIGLIFRIGTSAADVLGGSLAHALGLTMAATYDPALGATVDPMTKLVTTLAMLIAVAVGAHRIVIGAVIASVTVVPLGTMPDIETFAPTALTWAARSFDCGIGLALPAMTVSLSVHLALALVARAAPTLQIFSVGLSLTLASGLLVVMASASDLSSGIGGHYSNLAPVIERAIVR